MTRIHRFFQPLLLIVSIIAALTTAAYIDHRQYNDAAAGRLFLFTCILIYVYLYHYLIKIYNDISERYIKPLLIYLILLHNPFLPLQIGGNKDFIIFIYVMTALIIVGISIYEIIYLRKNKTDTSL